MRVRVLLFAVLRDAAGVGEVTLDLAGGATAADAAQIMADRYPALAPHLPRIAYAVNRCYASREAVLNDGDELAFIPPVSGG